MRIRIFALPIMVASLLLTQAQAQFLKLKEFAPGQFTGRQFAGAEFSPNNPGLVELIYSESSVEVRAMLSTGAVKNTTITVIDNASFLVVGDFNGDQRADVAFIGTDHATGADAVGVMLGNGDGTFQSTIVTLTPQISGPMTVGHFSSSGHLDLAIGPTSNPPQLTVLLGKGDGTFSAPVETAASGVYSNCIATGDFNNDGKLDVITSSITGPGSFIFLGNNDGTFQPPSLINAGTHCSIAVADLNGDGKLDLVMGTNNTSIGVLLGDGTGHFGMPQPYGTGDGAGQSAIAIADFNGDGHPDLAVLNDGDTDVSILLNNGTGAFTIAKTYNTASSGLLAFDVNGDHKIDLVTQDQSSAIVVLYGNGNGTFQDNFVKNRFANDAARLVAADFNNDHKLDLLAYQEGFSGAVYLGNGNGTFGNRLPLNSGCVPNPNINLPVADLGLELAVGDFRSVGKLDTAAVISPGGVSVCLGNGDGTFENPVLYDTAISHGMVVVGDFNNDGHPDLAVSDQHGISILLGNGDGTFQAGIITAVNTSYQYPILALGDFNHDGNLDVAVIDRSSVTVLPGKGNGTFGTPIASPDGLGGLRVGVGDLNKDGNLDLVISGTSSSLGVALGNGDGTFQPLVTYNVPAGGQIVLADFNGDGNLDVVAEANEELDFDLLLGDGTGKLGPANLYIIGNAKNYGSLAAGDFNGDGALDLVSVFGFAGTQYNLVTFLNQK